MRKDVANGKLADEMLEVLSNVSVDNKISKQKKNDTYNSIPSLVEMFKMLLKIVSQEEGLWHE